MSVSTKDSQTVEKIPMSLIYTDDEFNCRGTILQTDLIDLAKNIQENGLIQPIILKLKGDRYLVVAGNRRYKAHVINNAEYINAIVRNDLTDDDAMFINLSENLNRQDLDMLQEALSIRKMYEKGYTIDEIKEKLNVSRFWVDIRLKVTKLDPKIQEEVKAGFLTQEHINAVSSIKDKQKQFDLVKEIKEKRLQGIKVPVSKKILAKNPNAIMKRKPPQIQAMIDHIMDNIGANLATRCLAWANGYISSQELFNDIKKIADEDGLDYEIPNEDVA